MLENVILDIILYGAPVAALIAGSSAGIAILRKSRYVSEIPEDDEEEFVNIALCETRHGIKTHYHDIGFEALRYGGYPINKHPTLCGAEVGWDMVHQDAEAECATCRKELAKMSRKSE